MKFKIFFCVSFVLLIASFASAQVPCGGTIMPARTLSVNWPQFAFDTAHTACNPYETVLSPANVGNLTLAWNYPATSGSSPVIANGAVYIGDAAELYMP